MFGAIEAGGTKFVCAVGTGPEDVAISAEIPTTTPEETMAGVAAFFAGKKLKRVGIACFGPVDLAGGRIAKTTPKVAWRGFGIQAAVEQALRAKTVLDTDVNGAALGEHLWGAGQGIDPLLYVTVGTGIGGGGVVGGKLLHGLLHPEMGHVRVPRVDAAPGICFAHGDCLEGLASGPAIAARGYDYDVAAEYLGMAMQIYACVLSPRMVLLGGGVMKHPGMLGKVRAAAKRYMAGYAPMPLIRAPKFGQRAGTLGALALAVRG
jgi:fructokinase